MIAVTLSGDTTAGWPCSSNTVDLYTDETAAEVKERLLREHRAECQQAFWDKPRSQGVGRPPASRWSDRRPAARPRARKRRHRRRR